ncbi:MAG: arylformamidase [Sphingobacteriales bacterium]|jgi:arylformamidase
MKAIIHNNWGELHLDLEQPMDISIPMRTGKENVNAWYVGPVKIEPVRGDGFVGSVKEGGHVNFRDVAFNPHGNGTHTECVGHINPEVSSVQDVLKVFWFRCCLVSVQPLVLNKAEGYQEFKDKIIRLSVAQKEMLSQEKPDSVAIRTLPNIPQKINAHYSNTNPPYLDHRDALFLRELGVKHVLIDLPSVDRELDGGRLLSHRAFWDYPSNPRMDSTITELIFVKNDIKDGRYMLNLQMASLVNDASPSKPCLYSINPK